MRFFLIFLFIIFAGSAFAQPGPGYGFPLRDLRQPPDTGMLVYTKFWQGRPAAFFEYVSLIPGIGGGGTPADLTGIRDSLNFLYGVGESEPDTVPVVVYKPSHGIDPDFCLFDGCVLALTASFDAASLLDPPFTYAIAAPDPDSLEVQFSGFYTTPSPHGLTVGQVYYLTDTPGTLSTTPGSVDIPVLLVIDGNTVQLIDRTPNATATTLRISIPTSQFTSRGADPRAPTDSIVQAIAALYQSAGLARPGALFVQQLPAATNNPTHQAGANDSSTPVNGWVWDGLKVTRITQGRIAVNLQATEAGGSTPPVTLTPAAGPDSNSVAAWIDANFQNLPIPNGTILYWVGTGSELAPEYTYEILDDPTNTARRFLRLGGGGGSDGNGIYGGSGSLPGNVVVNVGDSGNTLELQKTGLIADDEPQLILSDETLFGAGVGIAFERGGVETMRIVSGLTFPFVSYQDALGLFILGPGVSTSTNGGGNATRLPPSRPGTPSIWQHNADGTGQYIATSALPSTNIFNSNGSMTDAARLFTMNGASSLRVSRSDDDLGFTVNPSGFKAGLANGLGGILATNEGVTVSNEFGNANLRLRANNGNNITIRPQSVTNAWNLDLPLNGGSAGQFLQTDGFGTTTWASPTLPNIGGISAQYRASGSTYPGLGNPYTISTVTLSNAIPLPFTVGAKTGITKVVYDGGHGIEVLFGGTVTVKVDCYVTFRAATPGFYYFRVLKNGSPVNGDGGGGNMYAVAEFTADAPQTVNLNQMIDCNSGDILSIEIDTGDDPGATTVNILSASLDVYKIQ